MIGAGAVLAIAAITLILVFAGGSDPSPPHANIEGGQDGPLPPTTRPSLIETSGSWENMDGDLVDELMFEVLPFDVNGDSTAASGHLTVEVRTATWSGEDASPWRTLFDGQVTPASFSERFNEWTARDEVVWTGFVDAEEVPSCGGNEGLELLATLTLDDGATFQADDAPYCWDDFHTEPKPSQGGSGASNAYRITTDGEWMDPDQDGTQELVLSVSSFDDAWEPAPTDGHLTVQIRWESITSDDAGPWHTRVDQDVTASEFQETWNDDLDRMEATWAGYIEPEQVPSCGDFDWLMIHATLALPDGTVLDAEQTADC